MAGGRGTRFNLEGLMLGIIASPCPAGSAVRRETLLKVAVRDTVVVQRETEFPSRRVSHHINRGSSHHDASEPLMDIVGPPPSRRQQPRDSSKRSAMSPEAERQDDEAEWWRHRPRPTALPFTA